MYGNIFLQLREGSGFMEDKSLEIQNINNYILKEKKNLNKEIGEKLREKRREKNVSLNQLAQIINTSPTYISQIEKGEYSMSLFKFILFCNALEIDIVDFLQEFIFLEKEDEEMLYRILQNDKNIADNILEFMKEKDNT